MYRGIFLAGGLALVAVLMSASSASAADVISGTCTATLSNDPGFAGYWKYCLEISWDLPDCRHALSHSSLKLSLDTCPCACDPGYIAFADTIGMGPGDQGCTVYYHGEFICDGDPSIPELEGPTLKFEPFSDCDPGQSGTQSLCFYSTAPPTPTQTFRDFLGLKAAHCRVLGDLVGALPTCECGTPVRNTSWGELKSLYK